MAKFTEIERSFSANYLSVLSHGTPEEMEPEVMPDKTGTRNDNQSPSSPDSQAEAAQDTGRGRTAWRPHRIRLSGLRDTWLRIGQRIERDLVPLVAAGVAFFGLLALFPTIATLASIAGLWFAPDIVVDQIDALKDLVPAEPLAVVRDQAVALAGQTTGKATATAVVSLALSLFWASRGIDNLVSGINLAHSEHETRNILLRNFVSLALTLVLTLMAVVALALAVVVPPIANWLGLSGLTDTIVSWAR